MTSKSSPSTGFKSSPTPGPYKHGQTTVKPSQKSSSPTQRKVVQTMPGPKVKC